MASNENAYTRLEELGGSNYEIVPGEPDIKGWDVKDSEGHKIGEVDELLFDAEARKVRYLVVDFDDNDLDLEDERKVLVPIGVAELHENDDDVILPNVTAEQLSNLPPYEAGSLTPETEHTVRNVFAGLGAAGVAGAAAIEGNDFYHHEHFDEDKFYSPRNTTATDTTGDDSIKIIEENLEVGKREVETGGARITSRLVERPVQETVNLKEEHVTVERTAVDRPASTSDFDTFKEGEIELTEHAEVPVVSKEARVVEEVSISKDVEEKEETIRDTVRSTEVEAEKFDDKDKSDRL
ncbi:DUF2382 domain-containing protein [Mucilaginibacter sp.]